MDELLALDDFLSSVTGAALEIKGNNPKQKNFVIEANMILSPLKRLCLEYHHCYNLLRWAPLERTYY